MGEQVTIEIVVVYKIDRLTRSLADFARMVEIFDGHGISFVAVTQQFNTTTSMGRLTLNVLLSFAQFEREVTAERIRDKIAASKKKGMWMGGLPPLGYDVCDRQLIVNDPEAETVRRLFCLYLEHGSVREVQCQADRLGLRSKLRTSSGGHSTGGGSLSRGHLYRLLANPLYVGKVRHHDAVYEGQHAAIIDLPTWDAVQEKLAENGNPGDRFGQRSAPSLLTGIVFDDTGDRLSPSHANKAGRRYRYYISHRLMIGAGKEGCRLPARALETVVLDALTALLRDHTRLIRELCLSGMSASTADTVLVCGTALATDIPGYDIGRKRKVIAQVIERIDLSADQLRLRIRKDGVASLLAAAGGQSLQGTFDLEVPFTLRRRGVEGKLVVHGSPGTTTRHDPRLMEIVARGHQWFRQLTTGEVGTIGDIAKRDGLDPGDVSRIVSLAFIAPDVAAAIVEEHQPTELTTNRLKQSLPLPMAWADQRRVLGFTAEPV